MVSCATVGAYSTSLLTGSVSSSSSVVPPQWLISTTYSLVHDARVKLYDIEEHGILILAVVLFASV